MSDYINRDIAIARLTALEVQNPIATMRDAKRVLADMPAAGVVPASKWIKCEDKLPPFVVDVLLLFESSMAVGYLREKHGSETVWDISDENGCGVGAHSKPLYWMPLPDPTKERKYCASCKWYAPEYGVCCNDQSEYCADFWEEGCEKWEVIDG